MDDNTEPEEQTESTRREEQTAPNTLGRQAVGALIGGAVAWILASLARQAGWMGGDTVRYAMWGAVIGGLIGAAKNLDVAGRRLTRRDNVWLNTAVSLVGMVLVSLILYGLAYVAGLLIRQVMGR